MDVKKVLTYISELLFKFDNTADPKKKISFLISAFGDLQNLVEGGLDPSALILKWYGDKVLLYNIRTIEEVKDLIDKTILYLHKCNEALDMGVSVDAELEATKLLILQILEKRFNESRDIAKV